MKYKCFIVEDSVLIREIYKLCLAGTDFEIIGEAADGKDALAKLGVLKPDVMILDIVLPEIHGFDVMSKAHQISPHTRTIVVSSLAEQQYKDKAKSLGAIFYLEKPFKKEVLLSTLRLTVENVIGERHG